MQYDVRKMSKPEAREVLRVFFSGKLEPQRTHYDSYILLLYKRNGQSISLKVRGKYLWISFYPNTDNIRFDCSTEISNLPDEHQRRIRVDIGNTDSPSALDFLKF